MKYINWSDSTYKFKHLYDIFLFPFSLLIYGSHHLQFYFRDDFFPFAFISAFVYLLIALYGTINKNYIQNKSQNWLVLYFLVSYFLWAKIFGDYRYFISSEIICPIIILILIYKIVYSKSYRIALSFIILFSSCLFLSTGSWGRLPWKGGSYFSVKIPSLYDQKNETLLITGYQGVSFVVPFFKKDDRFIRIQSNFSGLESNQFITMLHNIVKNQKNRLIVLTTIHEIAESNKIINNYNMYIDRTSCLPLRSIYNPQIILCKLSKDRVGQ
jgi:hypothetical protein